MHPQLLLLVVFLLSRVEAATQLLAIREVFTEGVRYPTSRRYSPATSESQLGELMAVGKRMHYLLGMKLYEEYWTPLELPVSYNQSYFNIDSNDHNASIESAQSHLYGLFDLAPKPTVNSSALSMPYWDPEFSGKEGDVFPGSNYQPVPIHIRRSLAELYANSKDTESSLISVQVCPASEQWYILNKRTDYYANKFRPVHEQVSKLLEAQLGGGPYTAERISELLESKSSNETLGLDILPIFKQPKVLADLQYLHFADSLLRLYFTDFQINASISSEFLSLRSQFRGFINGGSTYRFGMKSGHDINLIGHLAGLRLINPDCLYYQLNSNISSCQVAEPIRKASSLIYELHRNLSGQQYYVRVRYNGKHLMLPFCNSTNCSYERFQSFLNQTIIPNYRAECHFADSFSQQPLPDSRSYLWENMRFVVALAVVSLVVVGYFVFKLAQRRLRRNAKRLLTLQGKSDQPEIEMKEKTATDVEEASPKL